MNDWVHSNVDAFGAALLDFHESGGDVVMDLVRTEDDYVEEMDAADYFKPYSVWPPLERALVQWIQGRVLDVGAGAGRVALYLQEQGFEVTALDKSPGACDVCTKRGIKDVRCHNILDGPLEDETFDTILLAGYNLGIAGRHDNVEPFLARIRGMLNPGGRIIGNQINWDQTENPVHISFQESLRSLGCHPVEFVLRIKYKGLDEDFNWVLTSLDELEIIADKLKLEMETVINYTDGLYGYVLRLPE